jgi:GntR family transcriptional regulator, negative regulator for fad regulon and positive regulator of fabA
MISKCSLEKADIVFKAQSPAGLAEEYIIKSIWNHRYAPGTILPAERELSELIGVTRTTLREVLQRLARDGWLTIQHGKPTKVNNFWETSSLGILDTLAKLEQEKLPQLVEQLFSARTNISVIFIHSALKRDVASVQAILIARMQLDDSADAYIDFDYQLYHVLALASGNPIYALIFNGFKSLYRRVGRYYFNDVNARMLAMKFYDQLALLAETGAFDTARAIVRQYGYDSAKIWQGLREDLSDSTIFES